MYKRRVLLVQCCHLAQFFYIADKLRRHHPEWDLQALFDQPTNVSFYQKRFPYFSRVHCLSNLSSPGPDPTGLDQVVLPLLSRGYWKVKKVAWKLCLPLWEIGYRGKIQRLTPRRMFLSLAMDLSKPNKNFVDYSHQFPLPPLVGSVLVVETCHTTLRKKMEGRLAQLIAPSSKINHTGNFPKHVWQQRHSRGFDGAVVFMSGEPGFASLKCLPFLLSIPRIVIITETGLCFEASPRRLCSFLLSRIRHGVVFPKVRPRILLIQTETAPHIAEVLNKLKGKALFPGSDLILLCRGEDRDRFEANPHVDQLLTFEEHPKNYYQLWRRLRDLDPDIVCALFSGRSYFKKPKLLFFMLPIRWRLVFNAKLDCYDFKLRTFLRIFCQEPLLSESTVTDDPPRLLMIQTEHHLEVIKALEKVGSKQVAPGLRVSVLCHQNMESTFQSLPNVEKIYTYDSKNLLDGWRIVRRINDSGTDVVAAIFSGRPIFLKQKLLFFLLPARNKLIFNEHLDCFYFSWHRIHLLFGFILRRFQLADASRRLSPLSPLMRKEFKLLLFFPHFAYLLAWATLMKLKRVYVSRS